MKNNNHKNYEADNMERARNEKQTMDRLNNLDNMDKYSTETGSMDKGHMDRYDAETGSMDKNSSKASKNNQSNQSGYNKNTKNN